MKGNHHPDYNQAKTTVQFLLGPIKIKDGLFLGDQLAARDIEFIITNKVTHVINTVSKAVPNLYERFGVQYLSVHWTEKQQNIFDRKNSAVTAIYEFIEQAMEQGQSCLIHSLHGKSRGCAVLVAYLMKKYHWSLKKCLELIHSKKEHLQIRTNYLNQMQQLQKRLQQTHKLSISWHQYHSEQEKLLANTYQNAQKPITTPGSTKKQSQKKVGWNEKLVQKITTNTTTMTKFKDPAPTKKPYKIKSILKGYPNEDESQNNQQNTQIQQQKPNTAMNNFIATQKKPTTTASKVYNTRPFSSDTKQRQKKNAYQVKPNKLFGYDTFSSNLKNAYQQKLTGKVATNNRNPQRKKEESKPMNANERPSSANTQDDIKKPKPLNFNAMIGRQQLVITNSIGLKGKRLHQQGGHKYK